MRVDLVTIFPEYFTPLNLALLGRAQQRGLLTVAVHDLRQWTSDVHRTVDDSPYGGGPGMVMRPEPWWAALTHVTSLAPGRPRVVVPSPSGRRFDQRFAAELAAEPWLVLACGRYEGIDGRVVEHWADDEVSLGDYVLAGGEVAALVVVETVGRLLPGVVGNSESLADDSFGADGTRGLIEGRVYTRPDSYAGREVPEILRSGDHGRIRRWRRDEALRRTARWRPDLLAGAILDAADRRVLAEAGFGDPAGGVAD